MKNRHMEENFKLCLVKCFLLCSLLLLLNQDVLSAKDMNCEIKSSCSSSECRKTDSMTVDAGSNITLNCSITTGELVQGMTWNQTLERVRKGIGSSNLILQETNSTKSTEKYSCSCTVVKFARPLKVVEYTSTPNDVIENKTKDLKCVFSGWPFPYIVHWHKDNKLISNGTESMYHSLQKKGEYLHSILHLPPGRERHEGLYKCNATNSIPGWSSSASEVIEMRYECPLPRSPTTDAPQILANTSSNVSLTCWIDNYDVCPDDLLWYFNDNPRPLPESGEKYKIEVKETHTQCRNKLILSIFNFTENDEGTYSCHWLCEYENTTKAAIDLKVFVQPPADISTTNQSNTVLISPTASGSSRDWLLPIIILSAVSVAVSFMLIVRFAVKKKWTSSYNIKKHGLVETDFINRLFISYSSKDFGWVTKNLISVLEKHSIAYSIHSRDFELGRPIVQNMADNVYCSRQVLIVLSENYLASNFCREELHMAVQRGVDMGDSSLILVMIDNLKKNKLPAALRKKHLLDFNKHKGKQDWEEKILREILEEKLTTSV